MMVGKIPENVLKRSVLREIKNNNKDVITGASFGKDCAVLNYKEESEGAACSQGEGLLGAKIALISACNSLWAAGFEPAHAILSITLSEDFEESNLKILMETLEKAASSAYTDARLRRAVLFSLLGVKTEDLKKSPGYTQLLAANRRGLAVLSNGRKDRGIAVITKPADAPDAFAPEREADELYCMLTPKTMPYGEYIRRAPFVSEEK